MYVYDSFDRTLIAERVTEFRGQVARRLAVDRARQHGEHIRVLAEDALLRRVRKQPAFFIPATAHHRLAQAGRELFIPGGQFGATESAAQLG